MSKLYKAAKDLLASFKTIFIKKEEGATMVEYGLMVALIAVVCIAAVTALGLAISGLFENLVTALQAI